MKKYSIFLLLVVLLFSFVACDSSPAAVDETGKLTIHVAIANSILHDDGDGLKDYRTLEIAKEFPVENNVVTIDYKEFENYKAADPVVSAPKAVYYGLFLYPEWNVPEGVEVESFTWSASYWDNINVSNVLETVDVATEMSKTDFNPKQFGFAGSLCPTGWLDTDYVSNSDFSHLPNYGSSGIFELTIKTTDKRVFKASVNFKVKEAFDFSKAPTYVMWEYDGVKDGYKITDSGIELTLSGTDYIVSQEVLSNTDFTTTTDEGQFFTEYKPLKGFSTHVVNNAYKEHMKNAESFDWKVGDESQNNQGVFSNVGEGWDFSLSNFPDSATTYTMTLKSNLMKEDCTYTFKVIAQP